MQLSQISAGDKPSARRLLRELRSSLSEEYRALAEPLICHELIDLVSSLKASCVLAFAPTKGEPNILPAIEALIKSGMPTAFPISLTDVCKLDFRLVGSTEELSTGAYGIKEPRVNAEKLIVPADAVCIVPALGFDAKGMRIGYGKGYYDRFLRDFSGVSLGVAFQALVFDELPCDGHDVPVDGIITEGGAILPDERLKKYRGQTKPR